jgi:hypothetical protein
MRKSILEMSDDEKKELQSQLAELIRSATARIHYAEGRKTTFLAIGAALVASGVALFTATVSRTAESPLWYAGLVCGVSLALVGVVVWFIYTRQTNRYPWTSATSTWKWFYRDALPRQAEFNMSIWNYFWGWKALKTKAQREFTNQLEEFANGRILDLSDRDVSIEQDIQQLYVLNINDKYKNLHLSHLQSILSRGIATALILTLVSIVGLSAFKLYRPPTILSHFVAPDIRVDMTWRIVDPTPMSGEVATRLILFSAAIHNRTKASLLPGSPYLTDHYGILLPYDQLRLATPSPLVPSGGETTVAGSLRVTSDIAAEMQTMGIFFVEK